MDVEAWLRDLRLEQYAQSFAENGVDAALLPELADNDLKDLGIARLADRKTILKAIAELAPSAETPAEPSAGASGSPSDRAERRQLTVMFVDLVDSTELSHRLDPEDLREVMRRYQSAVAGAVKRFDGYVAKFMGDGVLAYFCWPQAHEDDAERALRAGLDSVDAVARLAAPDGRSLACRVGVATGLVVVGDLVGEGAAQEEAVVGETPNLAARLQGIAEPGMVVIAEATRRLVGTGFDLEDLGRRKLKGIRDAVGVFSVLGERVVESRFDARSGAVLLPMVGRDQELALLAERWELAKSGKGQCALLEGEAGIGKSRIARALLDTVADEPHIRIRYQCSPYHRDSALWPVIQQLGHAAGFARDDLPEARLDKLEVLLGQAVDDSHAVAPLIADLMGLDGATRYGELGLTPQAQRARTLDALIQQLLGLAGKEPVLVVLEDAHWIDPTTLKMIGQALDRIAMARVLILLTSRPDQNPDQAAHPHDTHLTRMAAHTHVTHLIRRAAHPHVTHLTLNRLGRAGVEAIMVSLGGESLPTRTIDAIIARTDGVPLFVEELTKAVLETGETSIPASLQDWLMARLDRIPDVKEIAQIAACVGRDFPHDLLAAVTERPEAELTTALQRLADAELIFRRGIPPEARYTFKHALVQVAAYHSLLKSRRQQLHKRIAKRLDERFPETAETEPELLAHHYTHAGLADQAITYWQKAGERAVRRSANEEAKEQLERGLELLEKLPDPTERACRELSLQATLGPALMAVEGQGEAVTGQSYARALELSQQVGDTRQHFQALWGYWRYRFIGAELRRSRDLAEQCLALAEQAADVEFILEGRFALGGTLLFMGDLDAARDHLERADELYDLEQHRHLSFHYGQDPGASIKSYQGHTLWPRGHPDRALERCQTALTLAEKLAHPHTLAQVSNYLAMTHGFRREWAAAKRQAEVTIEISLEQDFPQTLGLARVFRGRALAEQGDVTEGVSEIEEGLNLRKSIGATLGWLFGASLWADALGMAGEIKDGLDVLTHALDHAGKSGESFHLPEIYRVRGKLLLQQDMGNHREAADAFGRAIDLARAQRAKLLELRAARDLSHLLAEQGERRKADDLLAPIYGWFTEGFDTADLEDAKVLLVELR